MGQNIWDVVVVGGGPSGSAAAKMCAEYGLKTLLLERYKLPRRKVCTGALMCSMAQNMVKEVFGEPPREVLSTPPYVNGFIVYAPEYEGRKTEHRMHHTWRYHLDYWMNQLAMKAGAELWEQCHAVTVVQENDGCKINLRKEDRSQEITAKYIIGDDGNNSTIRRSIYPDFSLRYMFTFQEVYQTKLNLDPEYIHWYVVPPERFIFEFHRG